MIFLFQYRFLLVFFFLTIIVTFPSWSNEQPQEHNLKSLLLLALQNAPSYNAALERITVTTMENINAFSSFFPQFDIQAQHGLGDNGYNQNPRKGGLLSLSLKETLYDNGRNIIRLNRSRNDLQISKLEANYKRETLSLELARQYYDYLLVEAVYKVKQFQNSLLLNQFHLIEEAYYQGMKPSMDYLRFKARTQRASLDLKTFRNRVTKAMYNLLQVIGANIHESQNLVIQADREIDEKNMAKNKLMNSEIKNLTPPILTNHLQYKVAEIQKQTNSLQIDIEKRKYWPNIYLNSKVAHTINSYSVKSKRSESTEWEAFALIEFNFLDWGIRSRQIDLAKAQSKIENYAIDSSLLELKNTLQSLMINLEQFSSNYLLSAELMELEKKNYQQIERSYRNGKASFLDIANAVNDYANAQETFFYNFYELKKMLMEYYFHKGELSDVILNNTKS